MFSRAHKSILAQRSFLALLCILLLSLIALISASHLHLGPSSTSERTCSLCILGHAPVAPSHVSLPIRFMASAMVPALLISLPSTLRLRSYWVRPPPVA
jgi:hypothetical protein